MNEDVGDASQTVVTRGGISQGPTVFASTSCCKTQGYDEQVQIGDIGAHTVLLYYPIKLATGYQ